MIEIGSDETEDDLESVDEQVEEEDAWFFIRSKLKPQVPLVPKKDDIFYVSFCVVNGYVKRIKIENRESNQNKRSYLKEKKNRSEKME